MEWIDEKMDGKIDNKQFGGISGTSTTDVLLEMVKKCMYVCITFISDSAIQNNIVIQCWGP